MKGVYIFMGVYTYMCVIKGVPTDIGFTYIKHTYERGGGGYMEAERLEVSRGRVGREARGGGETLNSPCLSRGNRWRIWKHV